MQTLPTIDSLFEREINDTGTIDLLDVKRIVEKYGNQIVDVCAQSTNESSIPNECWVNQKEILKVKDLIK